MDECAAYARSKAHQHEEPWGAAGRSQVVEEWRTNLEGPHLPGWAMVTGERDRAVVRVGASLWASACRVHGEAGLVQVSQVSHEALKGSVRER